MGATLRQRAAHAAALAKTSTRWTSVGLIATAAIERSTGHDIEQMGYGVAGAIGFLLGPIVGWYLGFGELKCLCLLKMISRSEYQDLRKQHIARRFGRQEPIAAPEVQ